MTGAAELYRLQELDLAIDMRRVRLTAVEAQLGESETLMAARQEAATKAEALRALKEQQKEREWGVQEVQAKASDIEKKLYGGSVRNPKELKGLQADLTALRAQLRRREDELLASMLQVEEADGQLRVAQTALAQIEADWKLQQEALLAEKAKLQEELADMEGRRPRQARNYDTVVLSLYDLLRGRKDGRAVAKVEQGMCGGCRITLPMSVLQKAKAGLGVVQCVSCERILYVS